MEDIPIELKINDKKFKLTGAVQCKNESHYIAYCKTISGIWDKRDDLEINGEINHENNLNKFTKEEMKFSFFFYVLEGNLL